jgi:hypothetical protein
MKYRAREKQTRVREMWRASEIQRAINKTTQKEQRASKFNRERARRKEKEREIQKKTMEQERAKRDGERGRRRARDRDTTQIRERAETYTTE